MAGATYYVIGFTLSHKGTSAMFLLAAAETPWQTIVTGVISLIIAWLTLRAKMAADAAVLASKENKDEIKEVKVLTTAAVRQGNSAALVQLEMYEVLAKQLAEMPNAPQISKDLYARAVKAVQEHKSAQIKIDEEAKQMRADDRAEMQAGSNVDIKASVKEMHADVEEVRDDVKVVKAKVTEKEP